MKVDYFNDGDVIFNRDQTINYDEGDDFFYVIDSGEITISDFPKTAVRTITLTRNAVFGEAVLIREETRSAKVVAKGKTRLLKIPVDKFEFLTSNYRFRHLLHHIAVENANRVLTSLA